MDTVNSITLDEPKLPGICLEQECEDEATEVIPWNGVARWRLCTPHADQWRAIADEYHALNCCGDHTEAGYRRE